MKNLKIPGQMQKNVREFIIYTQATQDQQYELQKFLDMISPSLKQKVAISIFSVAIKNKRIKNTID